MPSLVALQALRDALGLPVPEFEFGEGQAQDVARGCFEEPGDFEDALGELFVRSEPSSPKKPRTACVARPKSPSDRDLTLDSGIDARRAT
jgi:hypothetical protein